MTATTAAAATTTGHRHRQQQHCRRPLTSIHAHQLQPPIARLLLSVCRGHDYDSGTTERRRHHDRPSPPRAETRSSDAHVPTCSPVAAAVAAAAVICLQRIRFLTWYHRPPPPRRPAVATANNNTVVGHSPPYTLPGRSRRCRAYCFLW